MSEALLRAARSDDLVAIVRVFLCCWRESYAPVLPAAVLDRMDDAGASELWTRVLSESSAGDILVASDGDEVLGVVRFFVAAGGIGYVASLYVSPDAQGRGLGGKLLRAAELELRQRGSESATLWVFDDNVDSLAFYAAHGWEPDGETRVQEQFGALERRLAKRLTEGA